LREIVVVDKVKEEGQLQHVAENSFELKAFSVLSGLAQVKLEDVKGINRQVILNGADFFQLERDGFGEE